MSAFKILRPGAMLALVAAALAAGCAKEAPKTEDIRPVRAITIASGDVAHASEFSGEVRARIESRLGFRVGGKITERKVDVGAPVRRGQVLMQLDPQDLRLAASQAGAALEAARTNRDLAQAELKRYTELRSQNFVSQAVLDARRAAFQSAEANLRAAQAAFRGQSNQAGYTSLVSDIDGVVTAVEAEAGQVVSPGTPVVRVAKAGEKEVVIGVPENRVQSLRDVARVSVRLWAHPGQQFGGRIREISPVADPLTRTYAVRVALPDAPAFVQLGMTASVQFYDRAAGNQIKLPLSALFQDHGKSAVWVVEKGAVRLVPVEVAGASGNELVVTSGLQPGQTVVTAGVHQLKAGQKVKVLGVDVPAPVSTASSRAVMAGAAQ
ncbi:efflux RND transporter periplasmic adaptor subunit [Pseudoduganella sp. GCM10020061]|uniref:efflux RND transporter periplasmic adaptor subunit n=1 Tax=Pseudoduganella sp. GCM10020061 TaxID=3317345 RepID=UPI00362DC53E